MGLDGVAKGPQTHFWYWPQSALCWMQLLDTICVEYKLLSWSVMASYVMAAGLWKYQSSACGHKGWAIPDNSIGQRVCSLFLTSINTLVGEWVKVLQANYSQDLSHVFNVHYSPTADYEYYIKYILQMSVVTCILASNVQFSGVL